MTESDRTLFMEHDAIIDLVDGMAGVLRQHLRTRRLDDPAIIGIHTGGAWIAEHLRKRLGIDEPTGLLDISFYRDDFTQIGVNPEEDATRYHISEGGVVLVTPEMLGQRVHHAI